MPTNLLASKYEAQVIKLFQNSLNQASDIPDLLTRFSESLETDTFIPTETSIILSNGIYQYSELIRNTKYLEALRTTFNSICDLILEKEDINFKIEGRRKGVINSLEKMLKLLKQGRSLDLFRDSMGIRVILFGEENELLQQKCFDICQDIISFMLKRHFTLCEADKIPTEVILNDDIKGNIHIPKNVSINPFIQNGIKNYIQYPKPNGYQSLHTVFRAKNSSFIEIQVRTEEMHLNAEYNDANHNLYKTNKYGERLHSKIDFSKVDMPGFRYLGDDLIYDDIGLQTSQLTFYRTKSF